jgi:transcriptional regulator with XRE-family HTH domain
MKSQEVRANNPFNINPATLQAAESQSSQLARSGEFILRPEQVDNTEALAAQPSRQEQLVSPKKAGRRPSRQTHTDSGEPFIGTHLRQMREEKGWDIPEAANRLGYKPRSVTEIEANRMLPSDDKLEQFAAIYGTSVDELTQYPQNPRIGQMPMGKLAKLSFEQMDRRNWRKKAPRFGHS